MNHPQIIRFPISRLTYAANRLDINLDELFALPPDRQFKIVTDRLERVRNACERWALAYVFFGRDAYVVLSGIPGYPQPEIRGLSDR